MVAPQDLDRINKQDKGNWTLRGQTMFKRQLQSSFTRCLQHECCAFYDINKSERLSLFVT